MGHEIFRSVVLFGVFSFNSKNGDGVAEGYAPCLGVGYCRKVVFEELSRGVRGEALACRGHPYMFLS